ncbi:TolC family protein [Xylophilus sp. GW821-FHT01B05]
MSRLTAGVAALIGLFVVLVAASDVRSEGVFGVNSLRGRNDCPSILGGPIKLMDLIYRNLCINPKTYRAYALIRQREEELRLSEAALLPQVDFEWQRKFGRSSFAEEKVPSANYVARVNNDVKSLALSWLLLDFGKTGSNIDRARELLISENFLKDSVSQQVIFDAAEMYFTLVSAQGGVLAYSDATKNAQNSVEVAAAKYNGGVGALADKLQAETAYQQSLLDESKAKLELEKARDALAIASDTIGQNIVASELELSSPNRRAGEDLMRLLTVSLRDHPEIRAAQSQLAAAEANIKSTIAEGRPSISLVATLSNTRINGIPPSDTRSIVRNIGVNIKIPLYEGGARNAEVGIAKAKRDVAELDLADTKMKVAVAVLDSQKKLEAMERDIGFSNDLLRIATQSFEISRGRYKGGVGTILELLSAQGALSSAKQIRLQSLTNWNITRIELLMNIGGLDAVTLTQRP